MNSATIAVLATTTGVVVVLVLGVIYRAREAPIDSRAELGNIFAAGFALLLVVGTFAVGSNWTLFILPAALIGFGLLVARSRGTRFRPSGWYQRVGMVLVTIGALGVIGVAVRVLLAH